MTGSHRFTTLNDPPSPSISPCIEQPCLTCNFHGNPAARIQLHPINLPGGRALNAGGKAILMRIRTQFSFIRESGQIAALMAIYPGGINRISQSGDTNIHIPGSRIPPVLWFSGPFMKQGNYREYQPERQGDRASANSSEAVPDVQFSIKNFKMIKYHIICVRFTFCNHNVIRKLLYQ
jgi:hypothetical protein